MKLKRRWKWRLRKLFLWTLVLFLAFLKYSWPLFINIKDPLTLDIPKCPACFGENLCPQFLKGNIVLTNWTQVSILSKFFNAKNIYFGKFYETPVILKKLAHNHEFEALETKVCQLLQKSNGCENIGTNVRMLTSLWMSTVQDPSLDYYKVKANIPEEIETFQCVKSQDLIDFLLNEFVFHVKNNFY